MSTDSKATLVIIPFPVTSHLLSTIETAKLLAGRDDRLSITILLINMPMNTNINAYTNTSPHPRITFQELPENRPDSDQSTGGKHWIFAYMESQKGPVRDAVEKMMKSGIRVVGFLLDMFCTHMIDVANDLSLSSYIFFPSGSASLGLMLHLQSLKDDHGWNLKEYEGSDKEVSIPTYVNPVPASVWPLQVFNGFLLEFVRRYKETKGILVNTFLELESHAISALSADHTIPPVYPVGPIIQGGGEDESDEKKRKNKEIIRWLDEQPESSVVFLCFGSIGSFRREQVNEIAVALERNGTRFLWSLRKPPPEGSIAFPEDYEDIEEALPEGFLQRCTGKVIGWAPQMVVLSHPAVGGFVSHCGWNSTLESIWCGVPVATWPLAAEQQLNAFHLVKELELAVEVKMNYRKESGEVVGAETIRKAIGELMDPENKIRVKVKEMQEKSRGAMVEGGSSYDLLGRLLHNIMDISS